MPRRLRALLVLLALGAAAPAEGAQRCDFKRSTTVLKNAQARVFWVKGRGADKRVYFGCRRNHKPILLGTDRNPAASDETHTTNDRFRLAGTWVAFHQTQTSDFGAGEFAQSVVVRSVGGSRRAVGQTLPRAAALKSLKLTGDGAAAWILATGDFREVDGVAAGASRATPVAVARGIDSESLGLAAGVVSFTLAGKAQTVKLTAPAPPATSNAVGRQGLDGRFGDCGTLVPSSPAPNALTEATQLARAPGGALVAAGTTTSSPKAEQPERDTFVVARFTAAGKFDAGFGKSGVAQVNVPRPAGAQDVALTGVAVQPDGKVLVGGYVELANTVNARAVVVRLTSSGALDETFGDKGVMSGAVPAAESARIADLALTADGGILVAGQRDGRYFVARLKPNGTLDKTFADDGLLADPGKDSSSFAAVAVADDGTIFAGGGTGLPLLVRLTRDGAVLSVSSDAPPATGTLRALEVTADGGVVGVGVGGNINGVAQALLARYDADGRPVAAFDGDGFALDPGISEPHDLAIAPDNSLLVSASFGLNPGGYGGSGLVRYSPTGARDTSFGFRGALGGTSSFGLENFDVLVGEDGTAHVAQDNGTAFAISRFAVAAPALGATAGRSTVCAMATSTTIGPLVKAGRIDVSLRLRSPGKVQLDAVVKVGAKSIPAGTVTVFRPYTEGAVASVKLTQKAMAALAKAQTAKLTIGAGAPGGAKTAYAATLTR
jgi:uncharacterized delta-60 repeat protein